MSFAQRSLALRTGHSSDQHISCPLSEGFWNFVSSIGAFIAGVGVLIFLVMLIEAFARKRAAGDNPWGPYATTLEWTLPSPPPFHQFNELPKIT